MMAAPDKVPVIRIDVHFHNHLATIVWVVFILSLALGVYIGGR